MCSETAIALKLSEVGKAFRVFKRPEDRLKQMFFRSRRFYEEYWAVDDVSMQIPVGSSVGIIGRNGSGKSTLLQMVCGTLQPSRGTIEVTGRIAALLELGAGFNPEFTGRENVFLAASILGLTEVQVVERFEAIAAFAGIGEFIDQPVKVYSSGMYARLAFAVAAHVDADILVIDEILAVGDAAFTQKCMRFIRKFKEKGTLLFVSHDLGAVSNLCDFVVWMDRGRAREIGPTVDVCHNYHVAVDRELDDGARFHIGGTRRAAESATTRQEPTLDHRYEQLQTVHERSVQVFDFNPDGPWFGRRGATIEQILLASKSGEPLAVLGGGEVVVLTVRGMAHEAISSLIVGFYLRDRLGQPLFGDNSFITYQANPLSMSAGEEFEGKFEFQMPYLPTGDYSFAVAVAEGTQANHLQHHWLEEGLIVRVMSSHVSRGLIGIPMIDIALAKRS